MQKSANAPSSSQDTPRSERRVSENRDACPVPRSDSLEDQDKSVVDAPSEVELKIRDYPFGLENVEDYQRHGLHPVHLGDSLDEHGRYRVIHKLGHGGFATVWLCRDLHTERPRYVSVKIMMDEASEENSPEKLVHQLALSGEEGSKFICQPLDEFCIHGPNGSHLCFVYPVLGPKVSSIFQQFSSPESRLDRIAKGIFYYLPDLSLISRRVVERYLQYLDDLNHRELVLRKICFEIVRGLDTLHRRGVCHGDLTPSNILLRVTGLDGLAERDVLKLLSEPSRAMIVNKFSGEPAIGRGAPQYLVYPVIPEAIDAKFVLAEPVIIDFGESFKMSDPPEDLGIPYAYRAPELEFDGKVGVGCDLWALGCTLFEIRTGRQLFGSHDESDRDDFLFKLCLMNGKLPQTWWDAWEEGRVSFEEDVDPQGHVVELKPWEHRFPRSIQEAIGTQAVWWTARGSRSFTMTAKIQAREAQLFADLLSKLLQYDPNERLSASDALKHAWFKLPSTMGKLA